MKKRICFITAFLIMTAVCFALAGCGDSSMDDTVFVHYMQSAYGEDIQCKQVYNIKNLAFVYKFTRG